MAVIKNPINITLAMAILFVAGLAYICLRAEAAPLWEVQEVKILNITYSPKGDSPQLLILPRSSQLLKKVEIISWTESKSLLAGDKWPKPLDTIWLAKSNFSRTIEGHDNCNLIMFTDKSTLDTFLSQHQDFGLGSN